ncbi:MAG: UPF0149 family protein [Magnetovibrio sp.]|nr:UPF0149 family protein [Magnetovibrio sp.]
MSGLSEHLELLDGFLGSDMVSEEAMTLSELDGFLAGMICCPAVVVPAEWMRQVWGETGLKVQNVEQIQAVNGLVMARYKQVLNRLDQGVYSPIYDVDDNEKVVWHTWAGGFLRAMAIRPEAWHQFGDIGGDEAAQAIFTLMRLCELGSVPEEEQEMPMEIDAQLLSVAPDLIPEAIVLLYGAKRAAGVVIPTSLEETEIKIGRNDPCPCGSGKKYKKCCLGNEA